MSSPPTDDHFLISLFLLVVLDFGCCKGFSLVAVPGLIAVVSLVVAGRLWSMQASVVGACGFSSCGTQASLPHSMYDISFLGQKSNLGRQILNHWTTREVPLISYISPIF